MALNYPSACRAPIRPVVSLLGNTTHLSGGTTFISQMPGPRTGLSQIPTAHIPAALNDSPLEFKTSNTNLNSNNEKLIKNSSPQMGAGPMDLENENEILLIPTENIKRLNRDNIAINICGDDDSSLSTNESNSCTATTPNTTVTTNNDYFLNGILPVGPGPQHTHHSTASHQNFMVVPGMVMDPATVAATLQMQQFPLMAATLQHQTTTTSSQVNSHCDTIQSRQIIPIHIKQIIHCKSCILYPPNPSAPPPTIRERPPGCRTVFVGGLPENINEDIIREVFESCGEITTLRLSKKNFCHIRFTFEISVDDAIYLSGYRIRIGNSTEATNCGRLHVDYAQARDDQYEWECKQRQLQRERRHRERIERDRLKSVSPQPIVHYTEHEATNVADKLKNDDTFIKAVHVLIAWLERGDCSKKNANNFYSMIQSTNAHVRRLHNDKMHYEEELKKAREQYRKQMLNMTLQFIQIEKVFNAAIHKKVWDHFTKAQRKNIDLWKKQSMELRCVQIDDDEMEMSDDDREYKSNSKRVRVDNDNLKEENDSLRCQLEAYKNEMNLVKSDINSDTDIREQQIKVLQETIRNLQKQLLENKTNEKQLSFKITELETKLKQANVKELLLKTKVVEANAKNINKNISESIDKIQRESSDEDINNIITGETNIQNISSMPNTLTKFGLIKCDEAKIIGLVSTFLVVHPFGASADYICSYIQKMLPNLHPRELEETLAKYQTLFYEETTGVGAKIERKWKFCGFQYQN